MACSLIVSCSGTEPVDAPDWVTYNTLNSGLLSNKVTAIAIGGESGDPWVGFEGGGLSHLESGAWATHIDSGSYLGGSAAWLLSVESDSAVWIGYRGGVARLTGADWAIFSGPDTYRGGGTRATAVDSSGNIWFGGLGSVARYDGTNWKTYDDTNSALFPGIFFDISVDGMGTIWTCGVVLRDPLWQRPILGRVSRYDGSVWVTYDEEDGVPPGGILSIAADLDGSIWVSSWPGEVGHLTDSGWVRYTSNETSLSSASVSDIAVDLHGVKWFATRFGLTRFDGITWTTFTTANSGLGGNDVRAIAIDQQNRKWIGTYGGGVSRLTD